MAFTKENAKELGRQGGKANVKNRRDLTEQKVIVEDKRVILD